MNEVVAGVCKQCQKPLDPNGLGIVFCSRACVARFAWGPNGSRKPRPRSGPCNQCGATITFATRADQTVIRRKLCNACLAVFKSRGNPIAGRTKGDLFASRKNWQSARSAIRRHACLVFATSGRLPSCAVCGYDSHVQIAHIRPVSEFPNEAKVSEINALDNLAPLCPNHHWEFDNGLLSLR